MFGSHLFRLIQGLSLITGLAVASSSPAVLFWPNPQLSFIDEVLYGSKGALAIFTQFCAKRQSTTVAAQWLRLAFHDMSTHNVTDGSGGLDASIIYELDRPQSVGAGMLQSLVDFNTFHSPHVSLADTIAMGVVLGTASCGGPVIPYRAGRINATQAGPATVPEPQQDLQTHIASFQSQGFNQTEMISLVACGHTLGGVRSVDFPTIVDSSVAVHAFDSTVGTFDTNVVTQYLANASVDPLVVTPNVTTQSDLRIFSSDGNVTMQSLSTMDAFNATCGSLFERMINTVPKQVRFTDPIEPFENKVVGFSFYTNNGSYVMNVALRRLTPNPSRTVTLYWLPRYQPFYCPLSGCSVNVTAAQTSVTTFFGKIKGLGTLTKYLFTVSAPLDVSILKFWFVVDENDGSNATVVDNHGLGYIIEQDTLLYDPVRSQLVAGGAASNYTFVVGVRNTPLPPPTVTLTSWQRGPSPTFIPLVDTVDLQADPNNPPADGYNFFTGNFSNLVTAIDIKTTILGLPFKLYVENDVFLV